MSLQGAVAIITGGALGIGFHAARDFLKRGVKGLTITDVNVPAGEQARTILCKEFGPDKVIFVKANSTDEDESRYAFEKTIDEFQNVDILYNNAGIINEEVWTKTINVNFKGAILNMRLAMQEYISKHKCRDYGTILNNCSILAINPASQIPVYSGSKHGLLTYSRSFFNDDVMEATKVKVMCICPGVTHTAILAQGGDAFVNAAKGYPQQKVEECGVHSGTIVETNKHGSIWISEGNELYEIGMQPRSEMRRPVCA